MTGGSRMSAACSAFFLGFQFVDELLLTIKGQSVGYARTAVLRWMIMLCLVGLERPSIAKEEGVHWQFP